MLDHAVTWAEWKQCGVLRGVRVALAKEKAYLQPLHSKSRQPHSWFLPRVGWVCFGRQWQEWREGRERLSLLSCRYQKETRVWARAVRDEQTLPLVSWTIGRPLQQHGWLHRC
jgi:hypothetical protein